MSDAPLYGLHRNPRFSANHLAEYLCTTDPTQREGVIRRAKFPRRVQVVAYQQIVPQLRQFLAGNSGDMRFFDRAITNLQRKSEREEGYNRDEALRCIAALEAFKSTFSKARFKRLTFLTGPSDVQMKLGRVSISARLDPPLMERREDGGFSSGGCVMFLASSPDARKNIDERTKSVAAIVHWALESNPSNMEPNPKLCMSFDAFGGQVVRAPDAYNRLRKKMTAGCREAANNWDTIEPPAGYDGPDWR